MATSKEEEYTLLPLSLLHDAPEILRIHYQVHASDPLYSTTNTHLPSLSTFISDRTPELLSRFSKPGSITAKLVLSSDQSKMVSYAVFFPPEKDDRSEEEKIGALWDSVKEREGVDRERIYGLMKGEKETSVRVLGEGWEGKWWCLNSLVTDEGYQRKGLGSRLIRWGLERIEEEVKRRNELLDGNGEERIEGCYLVASPQGQKTYVNAGFVKVGSLEIDMPGKEGGEKYEHLWFVKRFE
jgi:GNAT superfamily N-acetyltransferase